MYSCDLQPRENLESKSIDWFLNDRQNHNDIISIFSPNTRKFRMEKKFYFVLCSDIGRYHSCQGSYLLVVHIFCLLVVIFPQVGPSSRALKAKEISLGSHKKKFLSIRRTELQINHVGKKFPQWKVLFCINSLLNIVQLSRCIKVMFLFLKLATYLFIL